MKYKLNIQKKDGFDYDVAEGSLRINGILILEPTDPSIIEYDITEAEIALGITRCYREDNEVIINLTKFVPSLEPYKTGSGVRNGVPFTFNSKWDLSRTMTAEEVVNGNPPEEILDV